MFAFRTIQPCICLPAVAHVQFTQKSAEKRGRPSRYWRTIQTSCEMGSTAA